MPSCRAAPCCAVLGSRLVAVGGISPTQQAVDAVEVYDTSTKCWTVKDTLHDKLLGLSCVVRGQWPSLAPFSVVARG